SDRFLRAPRARLGSAIVAASRRLTEDMADVSSSRHEVPSLGPEDAVCVIEVTRVVPPSRSSAGRILRVGSPAFVLSRHDDHQDHRGALIDTHGRQLRHRFLAGSGAITATFGIAAGYGFAAMLAAGSYVCTGLVTAPPSAADGRLVKCGADSSTRATYRRTSSGARADEEVLHRQPRTDQGNVRLNVHVRGFQQGADRLAAVPVVCGGEVPVDGEVPGQAPPEVVEWLNVAEGLE